MTRNNEWPAFCCALIAVMIALDAGVPLWRDWPIGDAADFGVMTFFAVRSILARLTPSLQPEEL